MPEPSGFDFLVCPSLLQFARLNLDKDVLGLRGPTGETAFPSNGNSLRLVNVVIRRVGRIQTEALQLVNSWEPALVLLWVMVEGVLHRLQLIIVLPYWKSRLECHCYCRAPIRTWT